jgi:hypothetical protein
MDRKIEHSFPLVSIDNIVYSENNAIVSITVRAPGKIEFVLIRAGMDQQTIYSEERARGMAEISLDLSSIVPGFYHMIMYNDERVAHFQELEWD